MKNKSLKIMLLASLILGLIGCKSKYPDLNDNAIAFDMGECTDERDGTQYATIEYNGRTYMPYGTLKSHLKSKNIGECIGYIQNEDNSSLTDGHRDTRVYTLAEDFNGDYLMVHYIGTALMNPPAFWRATDTKNNKIDAPNYIESLDYNYWK